MAFLKEFDLQTERNGYYNITQKVAAFVAESNVLEGAAIVFCPHTTAGVTINENADPDVVRDLVFTMDKVFPNLPQYRHAEGNSDAHAKCLLTGVQLTVIITGGRLLLGRWQGIYFAEYDGPRSRKFVVKLLEG